MQTGIDGVFAQYFRYQNIENIHLGNEQAVRAGYWINLR